MCRTEKSRHISSFCFFTVKIIKKLNLNQKNAVTLHRICAFEKLARVNIEIEKHNNRIIER